MKTKLTDTLFLNSDALNFWITEEKMEPVKDKKTGEVTNKMVKNNVTGYYGRIDQLLESFLDHRVNLDCCEELQELLTAVKKAKEEIRSFKHLITLDDMKNMKNMKKPKEDEWEEEL